MLTGAAVVPHAPLLLPHVSGPAVSGRAQATRDALVSLSLPEAELLVLLSPHGPATGVYRRAAGSLAPFGAPWVAFDGGPAPDAEELARRWGRPVVEGPVDHGVTVPLLSIGPDRPSVLACCLAESLSPEDARREGARFADALAPFAAGRSVWFLASAHVSAALTPEAPLTLRPEGVALEEAVLAALGEGGPLPDADAWLGAGGCGAGPLAAFRELCGGRGAKVLCNEHPFGVGYLVCVADSS